MAEAPLKNIALLIDADNASHTGIDAVLTVLAELGQVNVRRAYGNWTKPGLVEVGQDHAPLRAAADPAVRPDQRQERHRHGDDDRCDRPALRRQGGRLRDHELGQRLHSAGHAPPAGRPARVRFRRRQGARGVQDSLHPLHRRRPVGSHRSSRGRPAERRDPASRPRPDRTARRRLEGREPRRGRLCQAAGSRPDRRQPLELRRAQLWLQALVRLDAGDGDHFKLERRDNELHVKRVR